MCYMFSGCSSLTSLDLSNFNTNNVEDTSGMFYNCSNLTELNLSNFDTSKVTKTKDMFGNCTKLNKIILNNSKPPLINNILSELPSCANLYVPSESVETYKAQWSDYNDRIFAIE